MVTTVSAPAEDTETDLNGMTERQRRTAQRRLVVGAPIPVFQGEKRTQHTRNCCQSAASTACVLKGTAEEIACASIHIDMSLPKPPLQSAGQKLLHAAEAARATEASSTVSASAVAAAAKYAALSASRGTQALQPQVLEVSTHRQDCGRGGCANGMDSGDKIMKAAAEVSMDCAMAGSRIASGQDGNDDAQAAEDADDVEFDALADSLITTGVVTEAEVDSVTDQIAIGEINQRDVLVVWRGFVSVGD